MFEKTFEPCKIGTMDLKNRLIMAPFGTSYASRDGFVTDRLKNHYAERAKGGVGLVIVEICCVDPPEGKVLTHQLCINDDKYIPGLRDLAQTIKRHGAKAAIQLQHAGKNAGKISPVTGRLETSDGKIPVAPSSIPGYLGCSTIPGFVVPRELTVKEIHELVEKWGEGARRAKDAGFDGVELHFAHEYLVHQFLSPLSNKRTDEYGRDFEGRLKFPLEIIRRTREKVGKDYPLWVRLNCDDNFDGGLTLEDSQKIAKRLEETGSDAIHVSATPGASWHVLGLPNRGLMMYIGRAPDGCLVHLAEGIKKVVKVPVIAVNKIHDPMLIEKILREGKADMVALGRALLADPEMPRKMAEGRLEDIRPCLKSSETCAGREHTLSWETPRGETGGGGAAVECSVNAAAGRDEEFRIRPAAEKKRVLVAGGGPAGMEAARVAALRGHEVILYEEKNELGGQLAAASEPLGRKDYRKFLDYLVTQIKKLGVKIELGKRVTSETVDKVKPDAVIVATGGRVFVPKIPGIDRDSVVTALDVLTGRAKTGEKVLVDGGRQMGAETAEYLAERGKKVTITTMLEKFNQLAMDIPIIYIRTFLLQSLRAKGVEVLTSTRIEEVTETGVIANTMGKKQAIKVDTVVLALGVEPNKELMGALKGKVPELYSIGDCVKPGRIYHAIMTGYQTALRI